MNPMERIGKILEVVEEYKARKRTEKISAAVDRAAKSIYKQLSDPNSPERQALDRAVTAALDREGVEKRNHSVEAALERDKLIFIDPTSEEEVQFREWARENYKVGQEIKSTWHPVVQDECLKIDLMSPWADREEDN